MSFRSLDRKFDTRLSDIQQYRMLSAYIDYESEAIRGELKVRHRFPAGNIKIPTIPQPTPK